MLFLVLASCLVLLAWVCREVFFAPLSNLLGLFLARFTVLREFASVYRGRYELENIQLHRRYGNGSVVRLAPGWYSLNTPGAAAELDRHVTKRRKIASLYSMTAILLFEAVIDRKAEALCCRFKEFAATGQLFDVRCWMQFFAFDVIGEISVCPRWDHNGILKAIRHTILYGAHMGIFSWLHWHVATFAQDRLGKDTILTKLLQWQAEKKRNVTRLDIFNTVGSNIAAGMDTIAISLGTAMYMLLKHPSALRKLREEIDGFAVNEQINTSFLFKQASHMPYLQACIKETFRIHPPISYSLVRIVPETGAVIDGTFFPPETTVGVNPWALHYNEQIFGPDASVFRPERWMQDHETILKFSCGAYMCLGKSLAQLEMSKLLPQLFRIFNFKLVDYDRPWHTSSAWLVEQTYRCTVSTRDG
ncbi:cytochrome P450 [Aspergillus neoniger CBS 115656]|uniref:Cytochrome P450 n=1 Tax=Aspergillus neoniger (strain CBS 115656) TaxID=1448310 RepID=A0A318YY49_ASPNB|nr:cytochrome P450 [Aspergillus neoniger CBS 115656]PYH29862.1 cytochrome P450 [Aspergillus neoniger CBS 115656]